MERQNKMKFILPLILLIVQSCSHEMAWQGSYSTNLKPEGMFEVRICIYKDEEVYRFKRAMFSDVGGWSKIQKGICYIQGNKLIVPNHIVFDTKIQMPDLTKVKSSNQKDPFVGELPDGFDIKTSLPIENNIQVFLMEEEHGKQYLREQEIHNGKLVPNKGDSYLLEKVLDKIVTDEELRCIPFQDK